MGRRHPAGRGIVHVDGELISDARKHESNTSQARIVTIAALGAAKREPRTQACSHTGDRQTPIERQRPQAALDRPILWIDDIALYQPMAVFTCQARQYCVRLATRSETGR